MNTRYRVIVLLLAGLVMWRSFKYFSISPDMSQPNLNLPQELNVKNEEKIKITVYYEALCSDSKNFIIKQLVPAFEKIPNSIILDLVPYGKAETFERDNKITFECQHAETECAANKIHACVINLVKDQHLQLKYVACMINDNMIPTEAGEMCGKELNINYIPISDCANNIEGSLLLKVNGDRTHAVKPAISFIPTIELDGAQKVPLADVLKNTLREICNLISKKPLACL